MKHVYFVITVIFLHVNVSQVWAQPLDDLLDVAGHENPRIASAYHAYLAALERVPQVGALPDPELTLGVFLRPMQQMMGNQVARASLMQMLPWFGTLDAAKHEAVWLAKGRFDAFLSTKSQVFFEVKATWYGLYLVEAEMDLTQQTMDVMKTLEAIGVSEFKSGGGNGGQSVSSRMQNSGSGMDAMGGDKKRGLVDVLQIQMESLELENRWQRLSDKREILRAKLNGLLNRPLETPVFLADSLAVRDLPVLLTEVPDSIFSSHPLLLMLEKQELALLAQKDKRHKMGLPTIGVGVEYGFLSAREGNANAMNGRDMIMPMVSVRIPLWRKKYRALAAETHFERAKVGAEKRRAKNDLLVSFEETKRDFQDAVRRRDLYEKQATLAQQALDILTAAYGAGDEDIEDVLRMQLRLLSFRLNAVEALVDHNVAVAMMERLMGR